MLLICWFGAIALIPLGDVLAIVWGEVATICVFAWILRLDDNFHWTTFVGVGLSFGGIIFIAQPPFIFRGVIQWTLYQKLGFLLVVLAMFCLTSVILLVCYIGESKGAIPLMIWLPITSIAFCGLPSFFGFPKAWLWQIHPLKWCEIVSFSLIDICAQLLNIRGIQLS